MGREIRRVPANWEHPKENGKYKPLYDEDFETAAREWYNNCVAWENGTHKKLQEHPKYKNDRPYYWMWAGNPPDREYYRPKFDNADWYQVYETVSEGTPVTPPFSTKEELVNYLVEYGDFLDQRRGDGGWSRKNAESFVGLGWAPSGMIVVTPEGRNFLSPRDGLGLDTIAD
jgi:hypothetical protein